MILAAITLTASLVSAMTRADGVAQCARETEQTPDAFVRHSFDTRELKLYDGTQVTVAISHHPCLAHNSVNRVLVYAKTRDGGYRLALDDYGFPDNVVASTDGTVTLSSHETVEIIDEATYVWNGTKYVFSPERSIRYDIAIGQGRSVSPSEQERPYVVRVRFAPGASSAVLTGSVAGGFGDSFEFDARAGQRMTVQILKGPSKDLTFDVYQDLPGSLDARELTTSNVARKWSSALPTSGTWKLDVNGAESMDHTTASPYTLVLTIH